MDAKQLSASPAILGLATGVPPISYSQMEIFEYLSGRLPDVNPHARTIFQKAGVAFRHVSVEKDYYAVDRSTGERNQRYLAEALPLGEATVRRCLDAAGRGAESIDDFFVVSCTGYDIPGLEQRFGDSYREYKRHVPRWLPRWRPWSGRIAEPNAAPDRGGT